MGLAKAKKGEERIALGSLLHFFLGIINRSF
jgi:hypothetical protein